MSTIAIVPSDVISKRMLALRLATLLAGAGHRAVMLVDEGDHDAIDDGLERRAIPIRWSAGQRRRRWRPVALWRASRDAAAALDTDALVTVLGEVQPDLLIIDIEEGEALALAIALPSRPPLAVLCSFFDVWPIAGLGPNDPGPAGGFVDRVRGDLRWPWMWFRMRVYHVRQQLVRGEIDRIAVSRALARRLGVRREFTVRQWLHPFAPRHLPCSCATHSSSTFLIPLAAASYTSARCSTRSRPMRWRPSQTTTTTSPKWWPARGPTGGRSYCACSGRFGQGSERC
jgi:hypothetical protein